MDWILNIEGINYLKNDIPFPAKKLQIAWQQLQQWFNGNIGALFRSGLAAKCN